MGYLRSIGFKLVACRRPRTHLALGGFAGFRSFYIKLLPSGCRV
jgi:hypothetical protein